MDNFKLSDILKTMYDERVLFIKEKNRKIEREYFTKYSDVIPMSELLAGLSYDEIFDGYKDIVRCGTVADINTIFELLNDYFLFSVYDMMYKKKLEDDMFMSSPIDEVIYQELEEAVKEKYNDVSVMRENPNFQKNMKGIEQLVYVYLEFHSLLYLLYYSDFQFSNGWEKLCPDTYEDIVEILNKTDMTIGDVLHGLVNYKCEIMIDILCEIKDSNLKKEYLNKVLVLQKEKHDDIDQLAHIHLPIGYFLNHNISDFMHDSKYSSSVFACSDEKGKKKIILK